MKKIEFLSTKINLLHYQRSSLFFLLFLGLFTFFNKHYSSQPFQAYKPAVNTLAFCAPITITETFIESKPHIGIVSLPVGSAISNLQKWSSNTSWIGNKKPSKYDNIFIPENSVLVLDESIHVNSIIVEGKLIIDLSKNINITTEYILINGSNAYFEWGTETEPYVNKGVITLVGTNINKKIPNTSHSTKSIVVMNNAVIEMHGEKKMSWTKLAANIKSGDTKIVLKDFAKNWHPGDSIAILSSRLNMEEAEIKTIKSISNSNKELTLNTSIKYPHIGNLHSYTSPSNKTWNVDIRAEVGMLSKSIKIQGDIDSDRLAYGGHMMIHVNGVGHIENVELYKMGQKSKLGRYPFHWHLLEERGAGQYLKNTSIFKSYNRAITIHGTESALVEGNFCLDHIGHGLFLEDGGERFNIIKNNVIALTRKPVKGEELTPSDNQFSTAQNASPASYWITNPNNTFINNIAGGSQGTGFWFIFPDKPIHVSSLLDRFKDLNPRGDKLGEFSGNTSHSNKSGFDIFDILKTDHSIGINASWKRSEKRYLDNNTWYANEIGVYGGIGGGIITRKVIFRNNIFIDNKLHLMHANYSDHLNCIFVAKSGENVFSGDRVLMKAYDGAFSITNSYLVGWDEPGTKYALSIGGSRKHPNYIVSGIEKDFNGPPVFKLPTYNKQQKGPAGANSSHQPRVWIFTVWDKDGSLTGQPDGGTIISNHNMLRDGTERPFENSTNTYFIKKRYGHLSFSIVGPNQDDPKLPRMTFTRTKEGTSKAGHYHSNGFYTIPQTAVILNDDFLYTIQFENLPTTRSLPLSFQDTYEDNDHVLIRMKNFGNLQGITTLENYPTVSTLTSLKNATQTTVAKLGNDFYIKFFGKKLGTRNIRFIWDTNPTTWPKLDTDNDGVTDRNETFAGTEYIGLGPLFENEPLKHVETASVKYVEKEIFKIYPNPSSSGIFHLEKNNQEWKLYNIYGILLKKGTANQINLTAQPSGVYILKLAGISKKLIKK